MTQPTHSPATAPVATNNQREVAIQALDSLKNFMTPQAYAEVLETIDAQCTATADQAKTAASPDMSPSRVITDWRELEDRIGWPRGNFFGPEFLEKKRGLRVSADSIPQLRITEAELENARYLNHMISYHPDKPEWRSPTSRPVGPSEWRQTSMRTIPYSRESNYLEQGFCSRSTSRMRF